MPQAQNTKISELLHLLDRQPAGISKCKEHVNSEM